MVGIAFAPNQALTWGSGATVSTLRRMGGRVTEGRVEGQETARAAKPSLDSEVDAKTRCSQALGEDSAHVRALGSFGQQTRPLRVLISLPRRARRVRPRSLSSPPHHLRLARSVL